MGSNLVARDAYKAEITEKAEVLTQAFFASAFTSTVSQASVLRDRVHGKGDYQWRLRIEPGIACKSHFYESISPFQNKGTHLGTECS